jgi:hypothetical protein
VEFIWNSNSTNPVSKSCGAEDETAFSGQQWNVPQRLADANHDILLPKLKFYGISVKDLTLYQSYLDNRYCRTAIYSDSKNSNKVSNWAPVRHGVECHKVLFCDLYFFFYI